MATKKETEEKKAEEAKDAKKAPAKKAAAKKATTAKKAATKKAAAKKEVVVEKKPSKKKEPVKDLKDLGEAVAAAPAKAADESKKVEKTESDQPEERVRKLDEFGRAYGTGRRKDAVARVWIKPGKGTVTVNGRDQSTYFARQTQRLVLNQPFLIVNRVGEFDVICTVKGGGLSGQAGAVRHGISRALQNFDPELRGTLKKAGMLTRDARMVERKKVGKHKARRSKQWAKR